DGTMQDLGGGYDHYAHAINGSGQIVGWGDLTGFFWNNGVMQDIDTLIPANSGWDMLFASGINDNGWIVGSGEVNYVTHAYLLTPPPAISSLTLSPSSVPGGNSTTGKVTLLA